jgi:putative intracellular protease/amidase
MLAAPPARRVQGTIRAAVYVGSGTAPTSAGNYSASLQALASAGVIASIDELQGPDVAAKLTNAAYDVVVFPGGSGSEEYAGIGADGAAAVTAFVKNGGGYLGTCAGSYLALTGTCCDEVIPGYCGGKTGCNKSPSMLGLVDGYAAEPWDR